MYDVFDAVQLGPPVQLSAADGVGGLEQKGACVLVGVLEGDVLGLMVVEVLGVALGLGVVEVLEVMVTNGACRELDVGLRCRWMPRDVDALASLPRGLSRGVPVW